MKLEPVAWKFDWLQGPDAKSMLWHETAAINKPMERQMNRVQNLVPLYAIPAGYVLVPVEPTEAMLNAARDWSYEKYGKPIGNEAAIGCYKAMIEGEQC